MTEVPFDAPRLDRLMEAANLDWILASSSHNTSYLLGGHRYFFHEHADAIGLSRYLPLVGYARGVPDRAFFIGTASEASQLEIRPTWVRHFEPAATTSRDAAARAALMLGAPRNPRIGIEPSFLPADAAETLATALPGSELVDATVILEELRSIKSEAELELLRTASRGIVESMQATFKCLRSGMTKDEIAAAYRREAVARGLTFDYALITTGTSLNRAPFGSRLESGEMLSLDSGGRFGGYVGDLCRMAVLGRPTTTMAEMLDEVLAVQQAARDAVRPGALGAAIYEAANRQVSASAYRDHMRFVCHGMGLITHEAPRLTDRGVAPYPATHAGRALETGMVLSVETHIADPSEGFVKIEDTLFVTAGGWEAPGDVARGWNQAG